MSQQGVIRRYILIIEKIRRTHYPSLQLLTEHLQNHGFNVSRRTIQRALEQIRYEFGFEVNYDRANDGYYFDIDRSYEVDSFLRFLEIAGTSDLIMQNIRETKNALDFISLESQGEFRGVEMLKDVLFAVQNCRKISFLHSKFENNNISECLIKPYLIKEYQSRWYVVGQLDKGEEFRTFGLDRIEKLVVTTEVFKRLPVKPASFFENTIGLTYSVGKPTEVLLSFSPLQGNYVKTLPLHWTQEIIADGKKELRIKLKVVINFELKQRILMYGANVKVIKPKSLAEEIRKELKSALKQY
jgi:predicted DNA-binding transcriptional regulator YafY